PSGYEPDELPDCSIPRLWSGILQLSVLLSRLLFKKHLSVKCLGAEARDRCIRLMAVVMAQYPPQAPQHGCGRSAPAEDYQNDSHSRRNHDWIPFSHGSSSVALEEIDLPGVMQFHPAIGHPIPPAVALTGWRAA
ncbi:hypothetical protein, partial [Stutzerimonas nitrititolerans]|uniref:hypothetical protein n=1 Tax=Stutzerimonas nitrititolerans TaxID=2482751 RepID=UPI0028AF8EBE